MLIVMSLASFTLILCVPGCQVSTYRQSINFETWRRNCYFTIKHSCRLKRYMINGGIQPVEKGMSPLNALTACGRAGLGRTRDPTTCMWLNHMVHTFAPGTQP